MDNALTPLRHETPELTGSRLLVESVVRRLSSKRQGISDIEDESMFDILLAWARPALATLILTSICVFIFQQVRDAVKLSQLEQRAELRGTNSTPPISVNLPDELRMLNSDDVERQTRDLLPTRPQIAGFSDRPAEILRSVLLRMLGAETGMFARLAQRYPNLASIDAEDGLDERERKILATEGQAFLKEFEKLIAEGKK